MQCWVVFNSIILNIAYKITEYYMDFTILLNITCNIGQYSIPYRPRLLDGHREEKPQNQPLKAVGLRVPAIQRVCYVGACARART